MNAVRLLLITTLCLLSSMGAHGQTLRPELEKLLQEVGARAQSGTRTATFIEIKNSGLLAKPLSSHGTLRFTAPDTLEKITTWPFRERLYIEGDVLTVEGALIRGQASRHVLSMSDIPFLEPVVDSIRATVGGDTALLARHYEISLVRERKQLSAYAQEVIPKEVVQRFAYKANAWTLVLTPRDFQLREVVQQILMHGADTDVGMIEFVEKSGDRTELWITSTL